MKKAIIATAVVCVLSLLASIALGMTVGVQVISKGWDAGREWLKDWGSMEWDENTWIDEEISEDELRLLRKDERPHGGVINSVGKITAETAEIEIVATKSEEPKITLVQYSKKRQDPFCELIVNGEEIEIRELRRRENGEEAILRVEVYENQESTAPFGIGNCEVTVDTGTVKIENLKLMSVQVQVRTGCIQLKNVQALDLDLHTDTGTVSAEDGCEAFRMLTASVDTGKLSLALPREEAQIPFTVSYEIAMGSVKRSDIPTSYRQVQASATRGTIENALPNAEENVPYTLRVGTGSIAIWGVSV